MDILLIINLFEELDDDEILRIELVNGTKIYCLPVDRVVYEDPFNTTIKIIKPIKDKKQQIRIDVNAIALICTMSRETYDLKLQRGELYV